MSAWTELAERAERSPWWREVVWAAREGAHWGWVLTCGGAVVVWLARGAPSPGTAAAAVLAAMVGVVAAVWRAHTRARGSQAEALAAVAVSWRRTLALYGTLGVVIPAVLAGAVLPVLVALVLVVWVALATIPLRARRRLLARLRIGAAAVAGTEEVRVGRAVWSGHRRLDQVHVVYPAAWAAHKDTRRAELVERIMWELVGPPPTSPAEARARPDYLTTWDHARTRLEVRRVPSLPRMLPAQDWARPPGALVLGQTTPDAADLVTPDGIPLALYRPTQHCLVVGATQHGKSSGVRAWAVDGLVHGVFPGGLAAVDGKGSGSLAALMGREGVHAVAHSPEEWRQVIAGEVAPLVASRYAEMLAWRSGTAPRPDHPRALLILDEIQQVLLACPDLADTLGTLARQALEANVVLWVLTQRPDARDAVPGALRDQLVDRATFGPLSSSGAKMAFDIAEDWHRALGVAPIQGRALTWMAGQWRPVQAPWLAMPVEDPRAGELYPPVATAPPARPIDVGAAVVDDHQEKSGEGAPAEVPAPAEEPPALPAPAAYDPADPYANRRRRRRS
ncbi:hypothetical protein [Streptosporangium saharense]|uniref:FtsK domain-containing protein n=1 Tax=Streptosporangium saharense TaxID=1706840 RepID=A0A7W7QWE4_9ACTN|nr:hypothetical protein [Streptosporangium saharense]MBB4920994.1 hypothetical protein [Streptosporangium saharense]